MKHNKTVEVPAVAAHTKEVHSHDTCDICGQEIRMPKGKNEQEIEVRYREGWSCPDGGSGTETTIDLCGSCFAGKLVPWVKSFGVADPKPADWDW